MKEIKSIKRLYKKFDAYTCEHSVSEHAYHEHVPEEVLSDTTRRKISEMRDKLSGKIFSLFRQILSGYTEQSPLTDILIEFEPDEAFAICSVYYPEIESMWMDENGNVMYKDAHSETPVMISLEMPFCDIIDILTGLAREVRDKKARLALIEVCRQKGGYLLSEPDKWAYHRAFMDGDTLMVDCSGGIHVPFKDISKCIKRMFYSDMRFYGYGKS